MDEAQGHRLCSACRSKRHVGLGLFSSLFSSHLRSLTFPPFHSTCNMPLIPFKRVSPHVARYAAQSQLWSKSQRKWQKKTTQQSPKQFNRRIWKETDNAFVANVTAGSQPRGRKQLQTRQQKRGMCIAEERARVFFLNIYWLFSVRTASIVIYRDAA